MSVMQQPGGGMLSQFFARPGQADALGILGSYLMAAGAPTTNPGGGQQMMAQGMGQYANALRQSGLDEQNMEWRDMQMQQAQRDEERTMRAENRGLAADAFFSGEGSHDPITGVTYNTQARAPGDSTGGLPTAPVGELSLLNLLGGDQEMANRLQVLYQIDPDLAGGFLSDSWAAPDLELKQVYNPDTGQMEYRTKEDALGQPSAMPEVPVDNRTAKMFEAEAMGYEPGTAKYNAYISGESVGGGYEGTGMDAQNANILVNGTNRAMAGDTAWSQEDITEYQTAYNIMSQSRQTIDPATGRPVTTRPNMSSFVDPSSLNVGGGGLAGVGDADAADLTMGSSGGIELDPQVGNEVMTPDQSKLDAFARRLSDTTAVLSDPAIADAGTDFWGRRLYENDVMGLANYAASPELQQYRQAVDNFINAQLRRESGAAIHVEEYVDANRQYFPSPGDGPEVIAQKTENREQALISMIMGSRNEYSGSPYRSNDEVRAWLNEHQWTWEDVVYSSWKNNISVEMMLTQAGAI